MAMKVYGKAMSGTTAIVLAALNEKDATDYELVDVDMMAGAHKAPAFVAMQPFGLVPVFIDGPLTMFESRAICRYIANKFEGQGTSLLGSTLTQRVLVDQWVEVESQNFSPAAKGILSEKCGALFTGKEPDELIVSASCEELGKVLDVYEARLTQSKYLAGDAYSLADLVHLSRLHVLMVILDMGDLIIKGRPHVKAWYEDISSRPAWKMVSALFQPEWDQLLASKASQTK